MSGCEIQTQRSEPAAWPSLLETAESAVPQAGQEEWGDSEQMRALYEALQEFSMDELSEVGFYAHSLAICEVAKGLRDPAARDRIVEKGAEALIDASEELGGGISAISRKPGYLEDAYADLIRDAYDVRPAPEQLVGEMAVSLRMDRDDTIEPKFWVPGWLREERYSGFMEGVTARMNREVTTTAMTLMSSPGAIGVILEGQERVPRVENLIRGNIILSAAYIAALVMKDAAPEMIGGRLPSKEVIDMLRHRSTKQAALEACGVRSGEFFDLDNPIVKVVDGQVVFNDPLDGGERPRPSRRRHISRYGWKGRRYYERDEALVCPGAGVRSMVPLSLDLVGRIIGTAAERLSQAEGLAT